jgi:hypothetical protein
MGAVVVSVAEAGGAVRAVGVPRLLQAVKIITNKRRDRFIIDLVLMIRFDSTINFRCLVMRLALPLSEKKMD